MFFVNNMYCVCLFYDGMCYDICISFKVFIESIIIVFYTILNGYA